MESLTFTVITGNRYRIDNSNNIIVSKEEMLKLKKDHTILKDFYSNGCQKNTKKKIEEIDEELNKIDENRKSQSNSNKKTK